MARRRRNKRYRRGRLTVFIRFFSFVLICAAIVTALILFFRVEDVLVEGGVRYTEAEILEAAGIEEGENLFLLDRNAIAREITGRLPYVQSVQTRLRLPDTVVVEITETTAAAAVESGEELWLISGQGKVLERGESAAAESYPVVTGCTLLLPTAGSAMALPEDGNITAEQLLALLQVLSQRGMLGETSRIDCSDEEVLVLRYADRFDVELPYDADFDKKMLTLGTIVDTLEVNETGTIILTLPDRSFFKPDHA